MYFCLHPAEVPGVARRQLTFFASPKKVSKERRPQVRRPLRAAHRNTGTTGRFAKLGLGTTCARGWVCGSSSNMRTGKPRSSLYCSATLMGTLRSKTSWATFVTESWRQQPAEKSFALHSVIPAGPAAARLTVGAGIRGASSSQIPSHAHGNNCAGSTIVPGSSIA